MNDIKRGEIFYISRGGASCGSEQQSDRPAVIVSNDQNNAHSPTVEVVYMTTQPKNDLPTHCILRSTGRVSTVLCEQVHTVAVERIGKYIGQASDAEMTNIDIALMISLSLDAGKKTSKKYAETIAKKDEEIAELRGELEKRQQGQQDAAQEAAGTPESAFPEDKRYYSAIEALRRTEGERDAYKRMYEDLFLKMTGGQR